MKFEELNGKTITQAFLEFHRGNPGVYVAMKKMALEAINRGKKKISFKMIMNVVRWEIYMQTTDNAKAETDQGVTVEAKINDAYGSRYARLFIEEFPMHKDKIELRNLRTE